MYIYVLRSVYMSFALRVTVSILSIIQIRPMTSLGKSSVWPVELQQQPTHSSHVVSMICIQIYPSSPVGRRLRRCVLVRINISTHIRGILLFPQRNKTTDAGATR